MDDVSSTRGLSLSSWPRDRTHVSCVSSIGRQILYHCTTCLSSVHSQSCPTICNPTDCSLPGFPDHHQHPELVETYVHRVGDAVQPSDPLSSPSPPALNLSQNQGLFWWLALLIKWPKYWSFSFNISPSNDYSGLISFRMDWFAPLATQGTLKSLFQHHTSKASIIQCSSFFVVQISHTWLLEKPVLTRQTVVGKVMSLLLTCCLGLS